MNNLVNGGGENKKSFSIIKRYNDFSRAIARDVFKKCEILGSLIISQKISSSLSIKRAKLARIDKKLADLKKLEELELNGLTESLEYKFLYFRRITIY